MQKTTISENRLSCTRNDSGTMSTAVAPTRPAAAAAAEAVRHGTERVAERDEQRGADGQGDEDVGLFRARKVIANGVER